MNTTLFILGNCSAVFLMRLERINIRADQPSVNPGTSENCNVKVQSAATSADDKVNLALGNSVINHCCLSVAVKFHLINSLMVSMSKFCVAGNMRYTGSMESTLICCAGTNF